MTHTTDSSLLFDVATYYEGKLALHGEGVLGVDWNSEAGQTLRFEQLCKVVGTSSFSINDLGCGYGALYDFLAKRKPDFSYAGFDVASGMISTAHKRYNGKSNARFVVASAPDRIADFGVASGIFNVRMNRSTDEWIKYIHEALDTLDRTSRLGFSFNCLTSYSDVEKMRHDLHYADPCALFDLCKRRYSKNVSLLHDYGMYEFTILVRKHP